MSKLFADSLFEGKRVQVEAGYDRPLRTCFCSVRTDESDEFPFGEEILDTLLEKPCSRLSAEDVLVELDSRGIVVPDPFRETLRTHEDNEIGNVIVRFPPCN